MPKLRGAKSAGKGGIGTITAWGLTQDPGNVLTIYLFIYSLFVLLFGYVVA